MISKKGELMHCADSRINSGFEIDKKKLILTDAKTFLLRKFYRAFYRYSAKAALGFDSSASTHSG